MPQEVISIQHFGGMITNPHKEDVPDNMGIYALDIDPTEIGTLKSIKTKGASYKGGYPLQDIPNIYAADWISYESSGTKYDLVYIGKIGEDILAVENFYDVETSRVLRSLITTTITPRCIKTFNNQVQIGNVTSQKANVVHRLLEDKKCFNDLQTISAGLQVESGECYNVPSGALGSFTALGATLSLLGATGYFQIGVRYRWAVSLLYDGLQESNLVEGDSDYQGSYAKVARITIRAIELNSISLLDSRVTAIKLYRAESSDDTVANLGLYRLVKVLDINKGDGISGTADSAVTVTPTTLTDTRLSMIANRYVGEWVLCDGHYLVVISNDSNTFTGVSWSGGNPASNLAWKLYHYREWFDSGGDYQINYDDWGQFEDGGATYEEETGMPETLQYQSVRYIINEVGGGYHWVTGGVPENEFDVDWSRHIFRSMKFRPNMFKWVTDCIAISEVPTALAWYNDRLYIFSTNTVYRINPELMYIEDTFFGAGAGNKHSVCVSEYGLYFCNVNGAYRIKDSGIEVISDPISETLRTEEYTGFKDFANVTFNTSAFGRMMIKAEVDKRLIMFLGAGYSAPNSFTKAFGFYIPTGQWYAYSIGSTNVVSTSGYFSGKDGEIYLSNSTATYRLFAGTTYETLKWISKEFHLNEPSQNKSWNMVKWDGYAGTGGATTTVKYNYEGGNPESGTASYATSGAYINIYKKTFQLYISIAGNAIMDSIDIIVRRLFGKR